MLFRPGPYRPCAAVLNALQVSGLPAGTDVSTLRVVRQRGKYSGRAVTYIRIVDLARARASAVEDCKRYRYDDLDAHPELVVRCGRIERDGTIVISHPRHVSVKSSCPGQLARASSHLSEATTVARQTSPAASQDASSRAS
jgi:hypothetical protein